MWYVLQVKTGDEIKVRDALLAKGVRALVPQESRMIRKDGKWGRRLYTLIPSYIFVDIKFAAEIYYTIRAIPSVIRFVGTGCGEPSTLTYLEAEWIRLLAGDRDPDAGGRQAGDRGRRARPFPGAGGRVRPAP